MSGSNRGRALLLAQRRPRFRGRTLKPLIEGPPEPLSAEEHQMWDAIIAAAPIRLAAVDAIMLAATAQQVVTWRHLRLHGLGSMEQLRFCYRCLGDFFVPMPARRELLFPDRPRR